MGAAPAPPRKARGGVERFRAGHAKNVLGEHIQRPLHQRWRVLADVVGLDCSAAFQHFEAVRRDEQRLAWFVEAMVGAGDALGEPAGAFRRADMHDEIDVAGVGCQGRLVEVATMARRLPVSIALSTLRRWPTSGKP